MLQNSILAQKAAERSIREIKAVYAEPIDTQIALFKDTLRDLEEYLDTEDLSYLTKTSLGVIKSDILDIIRGFRVISQKGSRGIFKLVRSIDGILENLRLARDNLFVVEGMFENERLKDVKREKFFRLLRECRKHVADSLELIIV